MLEKMQAAVDLHRRLISEDHEELQSHFEAGLSRMQTKLEELIPVLKRKKRKSMRQMPGPSTVSTVAEEPGINFLNHLLV